MRSWVPLTLGHFAVGQIASHVSHPLCARAWGCNTAEWSHQVYSALSHLTSTQGDEDAHRTSIHWLPSLLRVSYVTQGVL